MEVTNDERREAMERLRKLLDGGTSFPEDVAKAVIGKSQYVYSDIDPSIRKVIAMIAPQLPDDVEWPRFEDGEMVPFGDETDRTNPVTRIWFEREDDGVSCGIGDEGGDFSVRAGERVKRPALLDADGVPIRVGDEVWWRNDEGECRGPLTIGETKRWLVVTEGGTMYVPDTLTHRALDANGEPIEVGDTVWRVFNSQKGTVVAIEHDGTVRVDHVNGERSWGSSSLLTHIEPEPPDSWERLIGDAVAADDEGARGMCEALVLRAQALAGDRDE